MSQIFKGSFTNTKKHKLHRLFVSTLLILLWFLLTTPLQAKIYTANLDGKFTDKDIWLPSFPGTVIGENDTVYIGNDVKLNTDLVIKGMLMVRSTASLMGDKSIVVLEDANVLNFGIMIADAISNKGMVYNRHILELTSDMINQGKLVNQESMVVGNIMDNIGIITGDGGNLLANKKFMNYQKGRIRGNIDICSANFMNVDGGRLDSTSLSFCGQRIFSDVFLTADLRREGIILSLRNGQQSDYKEYKVERSVDGINYQTIATVMGDRDAEEASAFKYKDNEVVNSASVFYRVRLTTIDNREEKIAPVEIGRMFSSNSDNTKF